MRSTGNVGGMRQASISSRSSTTSKTKSTGSNARQSFIALALCSLIYVMWIVCCALLLEQESGPLTHIHSIGHLMKKQKSYIQRRLNKFAQKHHIHMRGSTSATKGDLQFHHSQQHRTIDDKNAKGISSSLLTTGTITKPEEKEKGSHRDNGMRKWNFIREEQEQIQKWHWRKPPPTVKGSSKQLQQRSSPILSAFVEDSSHTPRTADNTTYPLPLRTQSPSDLKRFKYPQVEQCSKLPGMFPVNHPLWLNDQFPNVNNRRVLKPQERLKYANFNPVDADPYLPWIHDVFPSTPVWDVERKKWKSTHIEFVAQNKRRCNTGLPRFESELAHLEPQVSLMQPIPIKRVEEEEANQVAPSLWGGPILFDKDKNNDNQMLFAVDSEATLPRYQLTSYEEADADGRETRFICRFHTQRLIDERKGVQHVVLGETLSEFPYNYEYVNWRKSKFEMLPEGGKGSNGSFWNSIQQFQCPIPTSGDLQYLVGSGESVVNDIASLYVDLIPIRTRVRKGGQDYFTEAMIGPEEYRHEKDNFDPKKEFGSNYVLPRVEASGRWTNIPICMPSEPDKAPSEKEQGSTTTTNPFLKNEQFISGEQIKEKYTLIGCTWASAQFTTRGVSKTDTSTQNRLLEWLAFHLYVVGVEHMYIYDNSGAHTNETSLKEVIDMFPPSKVTRIEWPSRVCNNNPPAHYNTGERSSQYAAEASCRLRYGPYTKWLASFDTDEYLVPMGKFGTLTEWLDTVPEDTNILSFHSSRSLINYDYTDPYWDGEKVVPGKRGCGLTQEDAACVAQKPDALFLETYNCDQSPFSQSKPSSTQRAKKQIYRPSYVLNHYVHYSTVTKPIAIYHEYHGKPPYDNLPQAKRPWIRQFREFEPSERFVDDVNEAVMIHTKSTLPHETNEYKTKCHHLHWPLSHRNYCRVGFVRPLSYQEGDMPNYQAQGYNYTCYANPRLETIFLPQLREELSKITSKTKSTYRNARL